MAGSLPTPDRFRAVMSRFATGVTVMTTVVDGEPHGMTANAVCSVSLEPLLVLVCVARHTEMAARVPRSGVFGLSVLAAEQAGLSEHFADPTRPVGAAEFDGVAVRRGTTGVPLIEGALAHLECRLWRCYDGGDHDILVGEVVAAEVGADHPPLVYFRSRYTTVEEDGR